LESGEQDTESSYTNAIDEWIIIDDVQKRRKEEIKERQGRADRETEQSLQWRQRQFQTFSQKHRSEETPCTDYYSSSENEIEPQTTSRQLSQTSSLPLRQTSRSRTSSRPPKRRRREGSQDSIKDSFKQLVEHVIKKESAPVVAPGAASVLNTQIDILGARVSEIKDSIDQILLILRRNNSQG
jgi:hypothetical protein